MYVNVNFEVKKVCLHTFKSKNILFVSFVSFVKTILTQFFPYFQKIRNIPFFEFCENTKFGIFHLLQALIRDLNFFKYLSFSLLWMTP